MENKNVGWIMLGISVLIVLLVFLFNNTLMDSVRNSCFIQHGDVTSCEMYDSVNYQTYLALGIVGVLVIFSLFLIFSKPDEKVVVRKNGAMFQADLIEKTGFSKARMTRIVDKLEGNGLAERKRRGMTNVVVLKEN